MVETCAQCSHLRFEPGIRFCALARTVLLSSYPLISEGIREMMFKAVLSEIDKNGCPFWQEVQGNLIREGDW